MHSLKLSLLFTNFLLVFASNPIYSYIWIKKFWKFGFGNKWNVRKWVSNRCGIMRRASALFYHLFNILSLHFYKQSIEKHYDVIIPLQYYKTLEIFSLDKRRVYFDCSHFNDEHRGYRRFSVDQTIMFNFTFKSVLSPPAECIHGY